MGVGQPGMQGHQARFDGETRQAESQGGLHPERKLHGGLGRGGKEAEQEQAGQHEQRAARAHHIVFEARLERRAPAFMHDQEIRGEGHQFPVAVEGGRVRGGNNARQGGEGQEQEKPVPAPALVADVAQGIDADHQGHQDDQQQEEPGRGRAGDDPCCREGQGRKQGGDQRCGAQAQEEGQTRDERAAVKTPVGRVDGRVQGRKAEVGAQPRGQRPAQQAERGHGQGQHHHDHDDQAHRPESSRSHFFSLHMILSPGPQPPAQTKKPQARQAPMAKPDVPRRTPGTFG